MNDLHTRTHHKIRVVIWVQRIHKDLVTTRIRMDQTQKFQLSVAP